MSGEKMKRRQERLCWPAAGNVSETGKYVTINVSFSVIYDTSKDSSLDVTGTSDTQNLFCRRQYKEKTQTHKNPSSQ